MDLKSIIPKIKHSLLASLLTLMCLFIITPLSAHATSGSAVDKAADAAVGAVVNSMSNNTQGGTTGIQNGVSYVRTGYLCYLLTKDGAIVPGYDAVALQSPGYSSYAGSKFILQSRVGHTVSGWYKGGISAPWNLTPWQSGGNPSNEPSIKSWLKDKTLKPTTANAAQFIADVWDNDAMLKFGADEYVLVIETIMNLQFSTATYAMKEEEIVLTEDVLKTLKDECQKQSALEVLLMPLDEVEMYLEIIFKVDNWNTMGELQQRLKVTELITDSAFEAAQNKLKRIMASDETVGGRVMHGDPIIGTIPNLLQYDVWNTTVFDSYLNKVAPHAEKIATDEAGFTAYTGAADKVSDETIRDYGLAMMIVSAKSLGITSPKQTTYDESKLDTPAPPADESDGTVTIIKSYRSRNTITNSLTHVSNHSLDKLSSNIIIEDEPTYKVKGWKVSDTSITSLTSFNSTKWETSIPGTISNQGTTPTTINAGTGTQYVYILLESGSGQTTYDESKLDTPAPPKDESDGSVTIIKTYRERDPQTNNLTHKGTFYLEKLSSNIVIEEEPTYKVKAWKVSNNANFNIQGDTWETSIPTPITQQGTTPTTINAGTGDKYVYVLLEYTKPLASTNYTLTESTISRHITLNNPDQWTVNGVTLPKLSSHTFKWTIPAHKTTCDGHTCTPGCICGGHTHTHTTEAGCYNGCDHTHDDECVWRTYYGCCDGVDKHNKTCTNKTSFIV